METIMFIVQYQTLIKDLEPIVSAINTIPNCWVKSRTLELIAQMKLATNESDFNSVREKFYKMVPYIEEELHKIEVKTKKEEEAARISGCTVEEYRKKVEEVRAKNRERNRAKQLPQKLCDKIKRMRNRFLTLGREVGAHRNIEGVEDILTELIEFVTEMNKMPEYYPFYEVEKLQKVYDDLEKKYKYFSEKYYAIYSAYRDAKLKQAEQNREQEYERNMKRGRSAVTSFSSADAGAKLASRVIIKGNKH